jgi:hypothetical protein
MHRELTIAVVAAVSRQQRIARIVEMFATQTHARRRLILVLNGCAQHAGVEGDFDVKRCVGGYPARARNHGLDALRESGCAELVSFWDDDDYYAPDYLAEAAAALAGNTRRVVGKGVRYVRFDDGVYYCLGRQDSFLGGTISGWVDSLPPVPDLPLAEDRRWCEEMRSAGFELRELSGLHYLYERRGEGHAWHGTKTQALHCFGPALAMGAVRDDVVTSAPSGRLISRPTEDDIASELAANLRALPIEWDAEFAYCNA